MNQNIFASFRYRNYRLFFTGQMISVIGTWLQMTAMPWLVYRLTHSAFLLGLIGFLSQIFILLLSPVAGTFADHYDKKKLLLVTQTLSMLQALALAALTLTGTLQIWHIVVLALFLSVINAFDMPARQSFVIDMVAREHLINAIGLNSMIFNAARLIGPAIAGILIATVGEGWCFLLNGLSFIAVIAALCLIIPFRRGPAENGSSASIKERFLTGIQYIRNVERVWAVLLLLAITGLIGVFPTILMPVFVKDIYHMDASGLGLFMSAIGVGALVGTVKIAGTKTLEGVEKIIYYSAIGLGAMVIAFAFVRNIYVACLLLAVTGYFLVLQMGLTNTFIQLTTPDELRGRVMGFFVMAFLGFAPLGSLAAGALAHTLSAPVTVALGGTISIGSAFLLRGRIFAHE